ncbi:MAG: alpha-amylase family glycosyl hydrolase [Anaerolineae bacterium]|nr:alpha-amylase family glycosyl hydrolase [Anaerolineae bacterium]
MAVDTPRDYRQLVIYEIYVRNHSPQGTFAAVAADLPRIRAMGVHVVWFMPIHPIGVARRKGTLGSPYAIADYRATNPEYGSLDDFAALIDRAHDLGLRVMIDVVFNHTAADARLLQEHPEWYHRDETGRPVTTVPEWSDIIDLVYDDPALWAHQIETLQHWVRLGVDGFRCDVASLLPVAFWERARQAVSAVKPGVIWLAESVHVSFIRARRRTGLGAYSDGELYRAFDITYDYDVFPQMEAAMAEPAAVGAYLEMLRFQDGIYPVNYVKLRYVENHDQPRIMARTSEAQALAWTALAAFNKGAFLIYAGQESGARRTPSLFERDPVEWGDYRLQPLLTRLAALKKEPAVREGQLYWTSSAAPVTGVWQAPSHGLLGLFNVAGDSGSAGVPLPDGAYEDLLSGAGLQVREGRVALPASAAILRFTGDLAPAALVTSLYE